MNGHLPLHGGDRTRLTGRLAAFGTKREQSSRGNSWAGPVLGAVGLRSSPRMVRNTSRRTLLNPSFYCLFGLTTILSHDIPFCPMEADGRHRAGRVAGGEAPPF